MTESARQSEYETSQRESLLDVVLEKLQKTGKGVSFTRLIYTARFNRRESSVDTQKAFYSNLLEKYRQDGDVTGLLLVYPFCCVHMIEAKTSIVMSLLRDVQAASPDGTRILEARVISSTEDIPSRCYQLWFAAFVPSNSSVESMEGMDSTTIVKAATDVNNFLRKIGPTLVGVPDAELRRRLSSLESYYEDVPSPELILSFVSAEDAPTIEEYLEIYDSPVNIDLESEQVWPMPAPLKY